MGEALWVTAYGMGLVFVALIFVMLSTIAVERLFRDRSPTEARNQTATATEPDELELVAVLTAAALAVGGDEQTDGANVVPPAGVITQQGPSLGWKASGRIRPNR
jgi:Na+-transporting methylmalonyl-CoA/oxaloacetate decarboxylase gamma subunit